MSTLRPLLFTALSVTLMAACFTPADPGPLETPPACPHLQIRAPDSVAAGTAARVSVTVVGAPVATTFRWSVRGGAITSGQGTPEVTVDTARAAGTTIFATVDLGGLAPECVTTTASTTFLVGPSVTTM